MKIVFAGLGNMGLPMALNLQAAGHQVAGYDISDNVRATATSQGLAPTDNLASTVSGTDVLVTMLPNGAIVSDVMDTALPKLRQGAVHVDCSTIDVLTARILHDRCHREGILSLDAPVSGGVGGASAGTLTFMVGGSETSYHAGLPLLDAMGGKVVHCGGPGTGQAAKICNNMLLAISMIGTCEAFSLGQELGLDPQALFDVMSTSSGSCWSVNTYCPVPGVGPKSPADNNYAPGFATDLMVKDAGLAIDAAQSTPTPLGAAALQIYKDMQAQGMGGNDFSSVMTFLAGKGN